MKYDQFIYINERKISNSTPTYFIADIAANHDGDLSRAKELIWLAKEAGADAAKFQHYKAESIVSDVGFRKLKTKFSHQAAWEKSVFDTYRQYECNREWNEELAQTASKAGIDFMTTPYDYDAVERLDTYIPAYKIGSGDITWTDFIETIAKKGKPVILATGASSMEDVERAVEAVLKYNQQIALLQCNTNYTGSLENLKHVNLRVLQRYAQKFPNMLLGLSDHTPGHTTVLGAIALGARIIEKHFTDDNTRKGPDHSFAMNPKTWREMVERSREMEAALGDGLKRVEDNERETVIVQRRCLRLTRNMNIGERLNARDVEVLRPAPLNAYMPYELNDLIGKVLLVSKEKGDALFKTDVEAKND
ncbi:N-acetylneuraminate synthase family protein [Paenibacillus dendritiformis]|uniref:N-acetylneuraminate synthase family protein n=1 Tax=Paenibacillus dendritiformis TaxID=130049 RepID=UPI000DAAA252|nr:N-acetylneuraminate synthase family protein [Paenibacillus dendritiformis]PZM67282.1 N-acetylneuraminate synthase [Paenibacillus dendritiformis]